MLRRTGAVVASAALLSGEILIGCTPSNNHDSKPTPSPSFADGGCANPSAVITRGEVTNKDNVLSLHNLGRCAVVRGTEDPNHGTLASGATTVIECRSSDNSISIPLTNGMLFIDFDPVTSKIDGFTQIPTCGNDAGTIAPNIPPTVLPTT